MAQDWEYRDAAYPALEKMRKQCGGAEKALRALVADRDSFIEAARKNAHDSWTRENGDRLLMCERVVASAEKARAEEVARIRLAESTLSLPYPEGTVVEEMRRPKHSYHGSLARTGKKGVIQIFRAGDKYPSTFSAYSVPDVGSVVVRELKKDGTPSLVVKKLCGWGSWYKDGKMVELKEKKEVSDAEV